MKKEKISKKDKEEFRLKFAKDSLEHKKNVYKTYLEVLTKYNMPAVAYSAIKAEETYHRELMILMETCRTNEKSFGRLMFGEVLEKGKKKTEIEKIKDSEEYYDKLIDTVEHRINNFPHDIKMKIAEDAIEKQRAWFGLLKLENEFNKKK